MTSLHKAQLLLGELASPDIDPEFREIWCDLTLAMRAALAMMALKYNSIRIEGNPNVVFDLTPERNAIIACQILDVTWVSKDDLIYFQKLARIARPEGTTAEFTIKSARRSIRISRVPALTALQAFLEKRLGSP